MAVARRQGMRNFVQDRIAHFHFSIQQCQRPGKGDGLLSVFAASKSSAGMIELKPPIAQVLLGDQFKCEESGIERVQSCIRAR